MLGTHQSLAFNSSALARIEGSAADTKQVQVSSLERKWFCQVAMLVYIFLTGPQLRVERQGLKYPWAEFWQDAAT